MTAASTLVRRRYRLPLAVLSIVLLAGAAFAHPVCVLIPEAERPTFESVLPLAERAARGEPFCNLGGQWYHCKSFLSRAFFF